MRRLTIRMILVITILASAALACVLPGGSSTPAPNAALTAAVETLSALFTAMALTTPTPEITPTTGPDAVSTDTFATTTTIETPTSARS